MTKISTLFELPTVVYLATTSLVLTGALFLVAGLYDIDSEYRYVALGIGVTMVVCGLALFLFAGGLRKAQSAPESDVREEDIDEIEVEDEVILGDTNQDVSQPLIERDYGGFVECNTKGNGASLCGVTALFAAIGGVSCAFTYFSHDMIYNPYGLICIAVAAVSSVSSMRHILRWGKFGGSRFRFAKNARAGRGISGTIITDNEVVPKGDFKSSLVCQETVRVRSGKKRTSKTYVRWSDEKIINGRAYRSRTGIPVSFGIPDDALSSRDSRAEGTVQWLLTLAAATTGINYAVEFRVDVRGDYDKPRHR